MTIIHGISLASTDVVRAVMLDGAHTTYAFVSMHDVIVYSAFNIIACASRVYVELGLEFQKQYKQLVPLVWIGASGMGSEPVNCLGGQRYGLETIGMVWGPTHAFKL
jgi:hypothetical protein